MAGATPERIDRSSRGGEEAGAGWPTIEVDLSCPAGGTRAGRIGASSRRPAHRHRSRPTRWLVVGLAAATLGVAASVPVLHDTWTREPSTPAVVERPTPSPAEVGREGTHETPGGGSVDAAPIATRDVATVAVGDQVAGAASGLVLVDADGVRLVDLDDGTVTDATDLGSVDPPILSDPDTGAVVFVSGDTVEEVDAAGRRRTIGAARGVATGLDRRRVWMLDESRDPRALTAIGRSSGAVAERLTLSPDDTLVGFHDGRPLVASGDRISRLGPDGVAVAVTNGRVVAAGGSRVLVRRCGPTCDEAVVVDLDRGRERTVALDAAVQPFGLGEALSPDGRWLVGLVFADRARPELAAYPLVGPRAVAPPRLVLSVGVLGFGGRAAALTWSPDAAVLAAPGSSRVALIDVGQRTTVTMPIRLTGSGPTVRWLTS